jgi:hypothetical protein
MIDWFLMPILAVFQLYRGRMNWVIEYIIKSDFNWFLTPTLAVFQLFIGKYRIN